MSHIVLRAGDTVTFELNRSLSRPRWIYFLGRGWCEPDGYSGISAFTMIKSIQGNCAITVDAGHYIRNNAVVGFKMIPHTIPLVGHPCYILGQWSLPGFFKVDQWDMKKPLECTAGCEAYARLTNQPLVGHSPMCQAYQPNPYTGR